jgi:hypothetical protein
MTETSSTDPTAEQITLETIRQWAKRTLETSVAAEGHTTPAAHRARGYEHAARTVLAILDMNGRPAHEPVTLPTPT